MRHYDYKATEESDRIDCVNATQIYGGAVKTVPCLEIGVIRIEMGLPELFRVRAAINQWCAENPRLANPHLVQECPLPIVLDVAPGRES